MLPLGPLRQGSGCRSRGDERERDGLTANGSEGCRFESSINSSEYFFRVHIFVFMGTVCELCFQDTYLAGAN
jgi:hypothetical protein